MAKFGKQAVVSCVKKLESLGAVNILTQQNQAGWKITCEIDGKTETITDSQDLFRLEDRLFAQQHPEFVQDKQKE